MNKKSILLIILCALILSTFIFAIGSGKSVTSYEQAIQNLYVKAKQFNETDYIMRPKEFMTVKEFLKQIESGKIQMVEVYYIPWAMMTHFSYSEEALRNNAFGDAKRVIKNPSNKHLSDINKALEEYTLDKMQSDSPDYRLGFLAKDYRGRVLTISVVYNEPVMSINGTQYRTDPKLVASIIELLPHKSYRRINKELVLWWYSQNMHWYKRYNEQDKNN
jgi:hypothetical protein